MEFNKAYNRQEFVSFLRNNFLPEDFVPLVEDVPLATATKYTTTATKLGTCDSLGLVVYEVRHTSRHDARVALSKEAFRLLADEMQERALVAFVPEDNAANYRFSFIEISFGLKDETHIMRTYSNPHRYSFLLGEGIAYYTPNKYLNEKGRVIDDGDLRARFSVETLTQDFYRELSDWYAWAIKIIRFPNDIKDEKDDDKYNHESAIRLITRLIFVWFLKQRHLIPDEFFDQEYIANNLIENFCPHQKDGLFDCLDDKDHDIYYDGFSDRKEVGSKLIFPDYLFFGEEAGKNIDLSEFYGDKRKKRVSARGIIDILKRYNFTVEENTPFDKEVSLDPELLGKVFENLLAAYNPETQSTARKQTGSFYTPREIVQYMVDESLVAHVKRIVGEDIEPEFRRLLQYTDDPVDLSSEQRKAIMQSLYACRILDPACGSGAFPMGMLQQMVHILGRIDPDNVEWKKMMMDLAVGETTEAFLADSKEERQELLADIERSFDENINRPDYARKLYLIEHCIYGVDIQPIAIQISKLRFFISLVVDQRTNNDPADNFGIRPLPNLEAKFVAANTLIGLAKKDATLFDTDAIKGKEQALKLAKHKIFSAKTIRTKRKYRQLVNDLRVEIANMLEEADAVGNIEAQSLASWDMFDQNTSSPFFDPQWMFDVKNGFDIVIGNPPYGLFNKKQNKGESITVDLHVLQFYKDAPEYAPAKGGMLNIFRLFIVKSISLLCKNGAFCEIFPLAYTCDVSAANTRKFVFDQCQIIRLEVFPERDNPKKRVFENAKMSVCILTMTKNKSTDYVFEMRINRERYVETEKESSSFLLSQILNIDTLYQSIPLTEKKDTTILIKTYQNSKPLTKYGKCYTGEIDMTFCKSAFTKDSSCKKMIRGANIDRYILKEKMSQGETVFLNANSLRKIKQIDDALFKNERVVMQGITGVNEAKRLKMTLSDHAYCANSVNYCLFVEGKFSTRYALALLNSKLLNYIFKLQSTNSNVNGYEVDNLPIAISSKQERFVELVNSILVSKHADPTADTSKEERTIDLMVYKLYGLTYDEVKVVDRETTITEEEYAKEE